MEAGQDNPQLNDVAQSTALGASEREGPAPVVGRHGPTIQVQRLNASAEWLLKSFRAPVWAQEKEVEFANYDAALNNDESLVEQLREAAKDRQWIGIVGRQPGRGKTHLAIASMLRSWYYDLCPSNYYGEANMLVTREPDTYQFRRADVALQELAMSGIRFRELHGGLTNLRCLCLDEIGRNMTGLRADIFYALTGEFYDNGGQLIWTAPDTKAGLMDGHIDGAFLDRAHEGLIVELLGGKSQRCHRAGK